MDIGINYLAVLIATLVAYAVGAVWHSPVGFGSYWMRLMGLTKEGMHHMSLTPAQAMGIGFVVMLLQAFVLAHFVVLFGVASWQAAATLGFWLWLGFLAPTLANGWLWEGKSLKLFAFNAAYALISIEVMVLVLALWQ
jgi:uncharacterized protein DUF1761